MTARLSLKDFKSLHGSLPKAKKPAPSRALNPADLEDTAQQIFVRWADLAIKSPCRYWFVPNGLGKLGRFMRGWATKMGLKPGVSDIHVMWPGGFGVIEFKSRTGMLSGYQHQFLADVEACGHYQGIARSLDDAEQLLRTWGCPLVAQTTGPFARRDTGRAA